ncbi:PBECR2 nuclease fold domain-containing protein, partial [Helicobacter pylori]|uniref:PBECR2 nuclease fold domain-containing protein n=1 Tax=Helicobacter pylori TaxID=210 RepID=UPI0022B7E149
DFFKNANEIDSSLRNSIEWLSNAGERLKAKMKEYESFFDSFNGVKNKENFIKHLQSKPDAKHRLAYLHLVEPTLKEPDIMLIFKDKGKEVKKEHIKVFQGDPKTIYYFLVTQDNDNKLITGLRTSENYLKAEIDKADIIHSFIPQDS